MSDDTKKDEILNKNIKALVEKHPKFFMGLNSFEDLEENVEFERLETPSGFFNLEVKNKDLGRKSLFHDPMNPVKEAELLADEIDLKDGQLRFLIGMGLGYLPMEIMKRDLELFTLVVVITNHSLFYEALKINDLTEIFEAENIHFISYKDMEFIPILYYVSKIVPDAIKNAEMTYFEPERELFPGIFTEATKIIQDQVKHIACGMTTSEKIGPIFFKNQMDNITTAVESANISAIEDLFPGKPVVVVGAGPSLRNNIEYLKKVRDKIIIITVDSALPILVKNGVYPDFATTVDFHHISYEKYRDVLFETEKIPFIYVLQCATMTLKPYRCKYKFFMAQEIGFMKRVAKYWDEWGSWYAIEAVSHLAILMARRIGGDPIYLLGFDLGFVGFQSHSEGTALLQNIDIEALVWVDDKKGGKIPTSVQMVGQRRLIELQIQDDNTKKFINISEGVEIAGAENADAKDVFMNLEGENLNSFEKIALSWEKAKKPDLGDIQKEIGLELKDINKVEKFCKKGLLVAENAKKEVDGNPPALKKKQNKTWIQQAVDLYDKITNEIPESLESAIWDFQGKDQDLLRAENKLIIEGDSLTGKEKIAVEMDLVYQAFRARSEAISNLKSIFLNLHRRISGEIRLLNKLERKRNKEQRAELYVELGNIYLKTRDFLKAEEAFKNAMAENEKNLNAYLGLGKLWAKENQHKLSMEAYEKGLQINSNYKPLKEAYEDQVTYPDKLVMEAMRHIAGDGTQSSGQGTENWAVRLCREALSLDSENEKAKAILNQAEKKLAETKERRDELLPFVFSPLNEAVEKLWDSYQDNPDFALRVLHLLKKNNPEDASILELMGLCFFEKGNVEKAKNFIVQARSLAPDSVSPRIHLARILSEEEKYHGAYSYIMEVWEGFHEYRPYVAEIKGDLEFNLGEYEDALNTFTDIVKQDSSRYDIFEKMAGCCTRMGHGDAALKLRMMADKVRESVG